MAYANRNDLRAYQREWINKRRQDWIDENGPCAKCGSTIQLEVDHVDPKTKLLPVSKIWAMSLTNPKRIAELAKCQVLCIGCHKTKSETPHGTKTRYGRYGCRCRPCTDAHTEFCRQARARRRLREGK